MPLIHVLDEPTINQIAAGEVVERPSAVVKELIENAMDSGATAITAEIKEGGLSLIRITDNGSGIAKEDIPYAFLRHATSKIRTAEDLLSVTSLGFRGEALSSIAAVAQVELITKTPSALNGFRYLIEGGEEKSLEEIGCPGGTTIIVRNLFYNTPARRKFLKSAMTEAGYISDLMERLMVSHPSVSFKYIVNNQVKLQSSGNNSSKDIIYHVYGRDVSRELLSVDYAAENFTVTGFLGKPIINRGNRNYENYFINGRYIKSNVITKAIEEAYKPYMMQHKYPFTSLYFEIHPSMIDVNVHPQKLEIRLKNSEEIYQFTYQVIRNTLAGKELIPQVSLLQQDEIKEKAIVKSESIPEPFEENRRKQLGVQVNTNSTNVGRMLSAAEKDNNIGKMNGQTGSIKINYEDYSKDQNIGKIEEKNQDYKLNKNIAGFTDKLAEKRHDNELNKNITGFTDKVFITEENKDFRKYILDSSNKVIHNEIKVNTGFSSVNNSNTDIDSSKNDSLKNDSTDIDSRKIDCSKNDSSDIDRTIIDSSKNDSTDIDSTDIDRTNIDSKKIDSLDIDSSFMDVSNIDTFNIKNELANNHQLNEDVTTKQPQITIAEQMNLFQASASDSDTQFLSKKALENHRIIGQVFSTYWLVEYKKELYIIDQHAAHEKVLYERIMASAKTKTYESQQLLPPIVLTLTLREQEVLHKQEDTLNSLGYEFEHFGGNEYSVRAVPADLYGISEKELLLEFIDELAEENSGTMSSATSILERVASLSCKAAVKANHTFSTQEAAALIKELLTLENPYNCPHGRPVIISMSQYELERKFKRVL